MAKTIQLVQVAAPTGITATLQAGGSLTAGVTYYYRLISVRSAFNCNAFSEPSAEVSATTSAGNQQIKLDWTPAANQYGVIIQRTTVSGSYPAASGSTPAGSYSSFENGQHTRAPYVWRGTNTLTDSKDSGWVKNDVAFLAPNIDHSKEYPIIEAFSDSNDTITMEDIYQADVAGGWGLVDKIAPAGLKSITDTEITDEMPYTVDGTIHTHDCIFSLRGMLFLKQGVLVNATTTTYRYGVSDDAGEVMPYIFTLTPFALYWTTDGTDLGFLPFNQRDLWGAAGSTSYNLIRRKIIVKAANKWPYDRLSFDDGTGNTEKTFKKNILGLRAANSIPVYSSAYEDNIFEGIRHSFAGEIADSTVRFADEGLSHRWGDNRTFVRPRVTKSAYDCTMGHRKGALNIDPIYTAKDQTDNKPYFYSGNSSSAFIGNTLVIGFTAEIIVLDINGDPISDATVAIKDTNGFSDLWEDTGETWTGSPTTITTSSTSITCSDGSVFAVDDIIRIKQYAERLKIDSIATNVLTISRAQQSTTARAQESGDANIYRQIDSIETNASGIATTAVYLTSRELYCAKDGGSFSQAGYEDDLVADGWIGRNYMTPHTLTISKPGYQTYTSELDMNSKKELVIKLEKAVDAALAKGQVVINADPSNPRSDVYI